MRTLALTAWLALMGCATVLPPEELIAARTRYEEACNGAVAKRNPAGLEEAARAIDAASRSFEEHGLDSHTLDLSYVALRKVQRAELEGEPRVSLEPGPTRREQQLDDERRELDRLARERQTERRLQVEALEQVAEVSRGSQGVVATLNAGQLFANGSAALSPPGRHRLDEIAKALLQAGSTRYRVEHHAGAHDRAVETDALSLLRAEAVRDYLVGRGVPAAALRAVGMGGHERATTARASHGRVAIIVEPSEGFAVH